jgi:hypothetical protein
VSEPISNLFRSKDAAKALLNYEVFLVKFLTVGRHARVVEVCRQLRRFAAAAGKKEAALFTYSLEMLALDQLQHWKSYWRLMRSRETALYGRHLDLKKHDWKEHGHEVLKHYGPLLYFRGEYKLGCQLLVNVFHEAACSPILTCSNPSSPKFTKRWTSEPFLEPATA